MFAYKSRFESSGPYQYEKSTDITFITIYFVFFYCQIFYFNDKLNYYLAGEK